MTELEVRTLYIGTDGEQKEGVKKKCMKRKAVIKFKIDEKLNDDSRLNH